MRSRQLKIVFAASPQGGQVAASKYYDLPDLVTLVGPKGGEIAVSVDAMIRPAQGPRWRP